ncbi:hypothetical protein ACFLXE_05505 [Chloroflexota bacterium]
MRPLINSPDSFAAWFTAKVPGAYRPITAKDARLMTAVGLIGKYGGYYYPSDLETVRQLLLYEQLREKIKARPLKDKSEPPCCNICGQQLPPESEGKVGRPKEYCLECESLRARARQRKWRRMRKVKALRYSA